MDEIIKQIASQAPMTGLVLGALYIVYRDLKQAQKDAATERARLIDIILDIKSRAKSIEQATTGDTQPTIARRSDLI